MNISYINKKICTYAYIVEEDVTPTNEETNRPRYTNQSEAVDWRSGNDYVSNSFQKTEAI